jgi:DNA-binding beta-propeller fold protein YncE
MHRRWGKTIFGSWAATAAVGMALLASLAVLLSSGSPASGATGPVAHASIGFEHEAFPLTADSAGHVFLSNLNSPYEIEEHSPGGKLLKRIKAHEVAASAIAADQAGHIWVDDRERQMVTELEAGGSVLRSWPAKASLAIAVDPGGTAVYLAGSSEEIESYSASGSPLAKWNLPKGSGQPYGIAVGPDGLVYVADSGHDRVFVYEPGGTLVRELPTAVTGGLSGIPYGIAIAPSGEVYLANTLAGQVEEFTPTGTLIRTWGGSGGGKGHFDTPTAIAIGAGGDVYVADEAIEYPGTGEARVQRFTAEGVFVNEWGFVPKPPPKRPRLHAGPPAKTTSRTATFAFSSGEKHATFRCRLTGTAVPKQLRSFHSCTSPRRYRNLAPGPKTFAVVAVVGGRRSRPATRAWTISRSD